MKNLSNIIALLTDFGGRGSHYVAAMKAVMLKINSNLNIIDISHNTKPFSIIEVAYLLKSTYTYFPRNTVFVIVVDPGVGSKREIIALKTKDDYYFVGPDNGIFPNALKSEVTQCVKIENDHYYHKPVSKTFHGRDIMAPVGAYINQGVLLEEIGTPKLFTSLISKSLTYEVQEQKKTIKCIVQYVDNFGNITTNIPVKKSEIVGTNITLEENTQIIMSYRKNTMEGYFVNYFSSAPSEALVFLVGSTGYLEISINQGNASDVLNLSSGDVLSIIF
ncbi:MAG: hypothetical protein GF317_21585|nr:hypothetical protein [Candidatus Lokiarchaeota archaeon]MBD3202055.1 hypothetical protein [Candidatus Lokiarchaeota archaeon]